LDAAVGWLGLGCADEARAAFGQVSARYQKHSRVLEARWSLAAF